jgi:hypothetical protein
MAPGRRSVPTELVLTKQKGVVKRQPRLTCSHGLASRSHPTFNIANTLKLPKFLWKSDAGGDSTMPVLPGDALSIVFSLSLFNVLRGIALSGQNGLALGRSLDVCQLTARRFLRAGLAIHPWTVAASASKRWAFSSIETPSMCSFCAATIRPL